MFYNAINFLGVGLENWDVSQVTSMTGTFWDATNFDGSISGWDISSVITMQHFLNGAMSFRGCLGYSNLNPNLCEMSWAFFNCPRIDYECLSNWDLSGTRVYDAVDKSVIENCPESGEFSAGLHKWIGQNDDVENYSSRIEDCMKRKFYMNWGFSKDSTSLYFIDEHSESIAEWRNLCPELNEPTSSSDNMIVVIGSVVGGIFALMILIACYMMTKRMTKKMGKKKESRIQNLEHELEVRTNALRYVTCLSIYIYCPLTPYTLQNKREGTTINESGVAFGLERCFVGRETRTRCIW